MSIWCELIFSNTRFATNAVTESRREPFSDLLNRAPYLRDGAKEYVVEDMDRMAKSVRKETFYPHMTLVYAGKKGITMESMKKAVEDALQTCGKDGMPLQIRSCGVSKWPAHIIVKMEYPQAEDLVYLQKLAEAIYDGIKDHATDAADPHKRPLSPHVTLAAYNHKEKNWDDNAALCQKHFDRLAEDGLLDELNSMVHGIQPCIRICSSMNDTFTTVDIRTN